jgi:hypothetical protein
VQWWWGLPRRSCRLTKPIPSCFLCCTSTQRAASTPAEQWTWHGCLVPMLLCSLQPTRVATFTFTRLCAPPPPHPSPAPFTGGECPLCEHKAKQQVRTGLLHQDSPPPPPSPPSTSCLPQDFRSVKLETFYVHLRDSRSLSCTVHSCSCHPLRSKHSHPYIHLVRPQAHTVWHLRIYSPEVLDSSPLYYIIEVKGKMKYSRQWNTVETEI